MGSTTLKKLSYINEANSTQTCYSATLPKPQIPNILTRPLFTNTDLSFSALAYPL